MPVEKSAQVDIMINRLDAPIILSLPSLDDDPGRPDLHKLPAVVYNLPCHRRGEGYMGGSVHPHNKNWMISVYWEGKRYRIMRHPITREPFYSQRAAEKQLAKIRCEIDECTFSPRAWMPDSPLSVRLYCEEWLDIIAVLPKTKEHLYRPAVTHHIVPFFGDKDIRKIRYNTIVQFKNYLFGKGLSEKSVYNYVNVLKKILHDAWRNEDIQAVPAFPKLSVTMPDIVYLTQEQQIRLIEAIPERHRPIFQIGMEYGLRNQEVRALQKDCISDTEIIIRRAYTYHRGQEIIRETTKTGDKGKRVFGLTTAARDILKSIYPHLSPFVFVKRNWTPYTNRDLNEIWHKAEEATGIKCKLQNALRHSLGCQLLDQGVEMDIVRDIYGHTNPKMTGRYAKRSRLVVTEALEKRSKIIKFGRTS